jgi:transcriptional regulator with XRE-family HTH domain
MRADCYCRLNVSTNEEVRKRARLLVAQGLNQKALAKNMGMSETKFSRWFRGGEAAPVLSTDEADRFFDYVKMMTGVFMETQRATNDSSASAGEAFSEAGTVVPSRRAGER